MRRIWIMQRKHLLMHCAMAFIIGSISALNAQSVIRSEERTAQAQFAASGGNIAGDFHGVWILADMVSTQCRRGEWPENGKPQTDRLVRISSKSLENRDYRCDSLTIKKVKKDIGDTIHHNLACTGKDTSHKAIELWHLKIIDQRKVLVIATLNTSDWRDASGKPIRNLGYGELPRVEIFLECK